MAMIRMIRGLVEYTDGSVVVVSNGGIGYAIYTNHKQAPYSVGSEVLFHTHLAVRENAHDLYGFTTRDELEIFELLITLPNIGPKSALTILSQADIILLKEAVANNDPSYLSKLSGIGKKSAEKIVTGLSEIFERKGMTADLSINSSYTGATATYLNDTIDALITLGYSEVDARKTVQRIRDENSNINDARDALRVALKVLNQT